MLICIVSQWQFVISSNELIVKCMILDDAELQSAKCQNFVVSVVSFRILRSQSLAYL
jgi:hypothetical protein